MGVDERRHHLDDGGLPQRKHPVLYETRDEERVGRIYLIWW